VFGEAHYKLYGEFNVGPHPECSVSKWDCLSPCQSFRYSFPKSVWGSQLSNGILEQMNNMLACLLIIRSAIVTVFVLNFVTDVIQTIQACQQTRFRSTWSKTANNASAL